MPKIEYRSMNIGARRLKVIETANAIIAEYQALGYALTLRQLYYQFVARALIPNTMRDYKLLGDILNDGRMAGLVDWLALEDRTRFLRSFSSWETPGGIIASAAESYRRDWWADQPRRLEVWIEKDALVGVIENICTEWQVPYFSCRGYTSQSEMWTGARRMARRAAQDGQGTLVLHFGDHDPSGIDMSRDIEDRIRLFMGREERRFELRRLALNMPQVERYNPPPNPAKLGDSRAEGYIAAFGRESWELDALEPRVIEALIRDALDAEVDMERMDAIKAEETDERTQLTAVSRRWSEVITKLDLTTNEE